jgi:hypothetical protein
VRRALAAALLLTACSSGRGPRATLSVQNTANDGPPPAQVTRQGGEPAAREERLIAKMLKQVSSARGLRPTRTVPGVVMTREALIARVKAHVAREVPPEAIRQEGMVLQLLGLVPQQFDYEGETFKLLESQLAGFYEPADGTMYMAADLDEDNADATLAHELVHALQDQHYDLVPHSKFTPGQSDKAGAFSALAEGDATSAMADVLIARATKGKSALDLPEELFVEQVLGGVSSGPAASAPRIMRSSLVAPYVYGTLFVHALRRQGGWAAVDRAWNDLPTTTEQILHVAKWQAHEAAIDVKGPSFAALGPGWKVDDEDTFGELGLRLAFEEWMGTDDAASATRGWGGDRAILVQGAGGAAALVIHVRFDAMTEGAGDGHARQAFGALSRGLETTLGRAKTREAAFVCIERPQLGPLAASRSGRDLVIVAGPATKGSSAWSTGADCALAKKWGAEVLGNP